MSSNSGDELRLWRYFRAATHIAKITMVLVLVTYVEGKIVTTYRDQLLNYYAMKPNRKIPKRQYESDFNKDERILLETTGIDPIGFDVTLIDKLLRRSNNITHLSFHSEDVWTKDNPTGSNSSIEYLIFKVKLNRNIVCHEMPILSEVELVRKLNELQMLYTTLINRVLISKGKSKAFIDIEIDKIKAQFIDLKNPIRENLTKNDLDVYKKEKKYKQKLLQDETVRMIRCILNEEYDENCYTNPAPWLDIPEYDFDTEDIFTKLEILEEDKTLNILNTTMNRMCDYKEILKEDTSKKEVPRTITVTAGGGFGKSTYTRLFVRKWVIESKSISGLEDFKILFFIELRSATERSFDEILRYRLNRVMSDVGLSFEILKGIMLSLNILVILDGQDESTENSLLCNLLDLTKTHKTIRLIITSRPTASVDLTKLVISYNMPRLELNLIGIAFENQAEFIHKYIKMMEKDITRQNEILQLVNERLPQLNSSLGDIMMSPLMLSLLALLWVAGEILDAVTVTEIFNKVHDSLKDKLITRILKKLTCSRRDNSSDDVASQSPHADVVTRFSSTNLEGKLNTFLEYLRYIAFLKFSQKEFNFKDSTTALLKKKIDQIELGGVKVDLMEHYLVSRKSRKGLRVVEDYSYRHLRLHEYDASQHVCSILATGNDNDKAEIMNQLKDERYNNIRAHTCAILAADYPELLEHYGKQIIDCEKPGKDQEVDSYLNLIMESKNNTTVVEMTAAALSEMRSWRVESFSLVAALMDVLVLTQPSELQLYLRQQSQLPPTLDSCLTTITSYDLELVLKLDPNHSVDPAAAPVTHDEYLMAVTQAETRATLNTFYGHLSRAALPMLPSSLRDLYIGVSVADLPHLYNRIPELTQLHNLSIRMCARQLGGVNGLAQLQASGRLRSIVVALYGVGDSDVPHISTLLYTLPPTTGRELSNGLGLALHDATLSGEDGIQLMKSLSDAEITCAGIHIRSTQAPAQDQQDHIRDQARHCFNKVTQGAMSMISFIKWRCDGVTYDLTPH